MPLMYPEVILAGLIYWGLLIGAAITLGMGLKLKDMEMRAAIVLISGGAIVLLRIDVIVSATALFSAVAIMVLGRETTNQITRRGK